MVSPVIIMNYNTWKEFLSIFFLSQINWAQGGNSKIQAGNLISEEGVWNKDHVIILRIKIKEINAAAYQLPSNMINFSKYN